MVGTTNCRCSAPARCGAFADERRIVGGDGGKGNLSVGQATATAFLRAFARRALPRRAAGHQPVCARPWLRRSPRALVCYAGGRHGGFRPSGSARLISGVRINPFTSRTGFFVFAITCTAEFGKRDNTSKGPAKSITRDADRLTSMPFFIHGGEHGKHLARVTTDRLFHIAAAPPFQGFARVYAKHGWISFRASLSESQGQSWRRLPGDGSMSATSVQFTVAAHMMAVIGFFAARKSLQQLSLKA